MSQKAKIIASKLKNNIRGDIRTPQDMYSLLVRVFKRQEDYFSNLDPVDLLKIVLYTYFLKKEGSFDGADKIMEDLEFIKLFSLSEYGTEVECEECGGSGNVDCQECDGRGEERCYECSGDGEITCDECDGSGREETEDGSLKDCDECGGRGNLTCPDCGGEGTISCSICSGDGRESCDECQGNGEVVSDTHQDAEILFVCSWDKQFNNKCELEEQTIYPVMDDNEFNQLSDKITLNKTGISIEPNDDIELYKLYCVSMTDTPELNLSHSLEIIPTRVRGELNLYGNQ